MIENFSVWDLKKERRGRLYWIRKHAGRSAANCGQTYRKDQWKLLCGLL